MAGRSREAWMPAPRARAAMVKRLSAAAAEMTTAALADMAARHPWFNELGANHRASITLVLRAGVDGFVSWFAGDDDTASQGSIFAAAPRSLQRAISLHQTVDLIRSTIETVEEQIAQLMPRNDRAVLETAVLHYSREVAFDAAEVYARAAEERGAWDARIEAMVLDAVVRGEADESVVSRASTLGWRAPSALTVVIGDIGAPRTVDHLRRLVSRAGLEVLAAPQGDRLVALLGGGFATENDAVAAAGQLADAFGPGPIVVGPVVRDLSDAVNSARAATAGRRAAPAWPGAPRPVSATALLPERALSGDGHARRFLAKEVYQPLADHSGDLLVTLEAFLETGTIEAASRRLFVHANTVRYRLARIADVTGYDPHDSRDAYALRLCLTLGRLLA